MMKVSVHARMRWFRRHGHASGWDALSSPQELAEKAFDHGHHVTTQGDRYLIDYAGCRFVYGINLDGPILITFYPIDNDSNVKSGKEGGKPPVRSGSRS